MSIFDDISGAAAAAGAPISPGEVASFALEGGYDDGALECAGALLARIAEARRIEAVEALLKASRLPLASPKTFDNYDFGRLVGDNVAALSDLRNLACLHARSNILLTGDPGVGKSHLAKAYGRQCCLEGYRTYYLDASTLADRLNKAARTGHTGKTLSTLVRPACLVVDDLGTQRFGAGATALFYDLVSRRYEEFGPGSIVITSNKSPSDWQDCFEEPTAALCAIDRIFDRASVFVMHGTSYRGKSRKVYNLDTRTGAGGPGFTGR
jgi:DNA replication protein DnaC